MWSCPMIVDGTAVPMLRMLGDIPRAYAPREATGQERRPSTRNERCPGDRRGSGTIGALGTREAPLVLCTFRACGSEGGTRTRDTTIMSRVL